MKKILMKFMPDFHDDPILFIVKMLLCSIFGFVAITLYTISIIVSNGFTLIVGISLMIWYVWVNTKDQDEK